MARFQGTLNARRAPRDRDALSPSRVPPDRRSGALHEAVDADAAPQHLVDTGRDDLPAVEVSAQSAGGVYEARDEVVDVARCLPTDDPSAVWRLSEAATKLLGVLLDPREQVFDLLVGGARRLWLCRRKCASAGEGEHGRQTEYVLRDPNMTMTFRIRVSMRVEDLEEGVCSVVNSREPRIQPHGASLGPTLAQSCRTTLRRELWIFRPPLYSMNPSLRNLFMKKLTRERVVPTISARSSCDSFGRTRSVGLLFAVPRQEQQRPCESFLARVEELVDEVLLDPNISPQHVREESVGKRRPLVKLPRHLVLLDREDGACGHGSRRSHTLGLAGETAFAEKRAGLEDGDHGFLARTRDDGQLNMAGLQVHHTRGGIALGKDPRSGLVLDPLCARHRSIRTRPPGPPGALALSCPLPHCRLCARPLAVQGTDRGSRCCFRLSRGIAVACACSTPKATGNNPFRARGERMVEMRQT